MPSWRVPAFGTVAIALLALGLVLGKGKLTLFADHLAASLPQEVLADGEQLEFFKSLDMLESLSRLEEKDDGQVKPKPTQSSLENIDPAMA
jgi:hypothetical protein